MTWQDLSTYRWHLTGAVAVLLLILWYTMSFSPLRHERATLTTRESALSEESRQLGRQIEQAKAPAAVDRPTLPGRVAPALAGELSGTDRLEYFLARITGPANEAGLRYFTVNPEGQTIHPGYVEMPFSIAVEGTYRSLVDYLYELEYGKAFLVRQPDLSITDEGDIHASLRLSAILLREAPPEADESRTDPGRPSKVELARNPFSRPTARVVTGPDGRTYFLNVLPGLRLSGIMATSGRQVAIINGEPYHVGDEIQGKRIVVISAKGVELRDEMRSYLIEMEQPSPLRSNGQGEERSR